MVLKTLKYGIVIILFINEVFIMCLLMKELADGVIITLLLQ